MMMLDMNQKNTSKQVGQTILICENVEGLYMLHNGRTVPQDAQKGCPARPQRAEMKLADFFSILLNREGEGYGA